MASKRQKNWKPGMDLPYAVPPGKNGMLAILLHREWLKADRSGEPLLLPPAIGAIDQLRAVFSTKDQITPGFIVSLRAAIGLTQLEFGQKLGVTKMTVSRWERGTMWPSAVLVAAIQKLKEQAQHEGVQIRGGNSTRSRRSA